MDFTRPWDYGDIVFVVENKKLYANKATLSMSSDVFKAMFTAAFSEKNLQQIPLPYKKFEDFLQLMQVVHPSYNKPLDDTNVQCILPLAHEYQMQRVCEDCVTALCARPPSVLNLALADRYNLPLLYTTCMKYAQQTPLAALKAETGFDELTDSTLAELLSEQIEVLTDQNEALRCQNEQLTAGNKNSTELQVKIANICNGIINSPSYQICQKDEGIDRHTLGTDRRCRTCSHYNIDKIYRIVRQ